MSQRVSTFNINKYSIYKSDQTWYHYPQRSELSICFINHESDEISVIIQCGGSNLDNFELLKTDKVITTVLCKSPSIGVKQLDKNGDILKRFQISLVNESEYSKCCDLLKYNFNFHLSQKQKEMSSQSQSNYNSQFQPPSQTYYYTQPFPPIIQASSIPPPAVRPFESFTYPCSNQSVIYPNFNPTNSVSQEPTPPVIISTDDIDEMKKLTDSELRAAIRTHLKSKDFVDFVTRLDRILDDF